MFKRLEHFAKHLELSYESLYIGAFFFLKKLLFL